jgi:acetyltransferase-like isoleucine patch superfamily enzyme
LLSFGDNVHIASGVRFVTHDISAKMFCCMDPDGRYVNRVGPISVGSHVFIGANATILYDVCIGDRVIIAAGALVNKNLPSDGVYAGVPARKIGEFEEYRQKIADISTQYTWSDQDSPEERRRKQEHFFFASEMKQDK